MKGYFTSLEKVLWSVSTGVILVTFLLFDRSSWLNLAASLVGVTSLIFCAKGHPVGQVLMIAFSLLYGVISWQVRYYGEMITYLGMTLPMAVLALVAWLRNPFELGKAEVRVARITRRDWAVVLTLTAAVTVVFYFILRALGTANLIPSTVSVTTSFLAAYLTARRSPYYALAYAGNDLVLILLWVLMAREDPSSASVIACFAAFLANDLYGFVSWRRMEKRQSVAA